MFRKPNGVIILLEWVGMIMTLQDIKQTAVFDAPIKKVWDSVSTSEGMAAWFMPNDFEPIVGHDFHVQSPFGPSPCKVMEVDKPYRLSFTWDTEGWFVTFLLKEMGNQTEFTLIHGGWKDADSQVEKAHTKSSIIRERMAGGWVGIINERLKKVVEG